jgi:hypothetical protein
LLAGDAWASVKAELVNVRSAPGLTAPVIGTVRSRQLVYIHPTESRAASGYHWYEIQASPTLRGWAAAADAEEVLLSHEGADWNLEWCVVPSSRAYETAEERPNATLILGAVQVPSNLFSVTALDTIDLAWGDGAQVVCPTFEIRGGALASATLRADFETCGNPFAGAVGWFLSYGEPSIGPKVRISASIFGYTEYTPLTKNPEQLLLLAGARSGTWEVPDQILCIDLDVRGGRDNTVKTAVFRADVCANVVSVDTDVVTLRGFSPGDGSSALQFFRYPGSEIDPGILAGLTLGIAVEAEDGPEGAVRMRPATVPACVAGL